jgi:hypothetical protein
MPPLDDVQPRLVKWAEECQLDYLVYKSTACAYVLVLSKGDSDAQMGLAHGSRTVAQKLMLGYLPSRIKPGAPFLEKLVKLTNGGQAPVVLWSKGPKYTLPALTQTLSKAGRLMNAENSFVDLVYDGDVKIMDVGRLHHARSVIQDDMRNNIFSQKADLHGDVVLEFGLYDKKGRLLPPGPTKKLGARTKVVISGMPGQYYAKQKHWWIYSKDGNRGKTTTVCEAIVGPYKAIFIADIRNAMSLPTDAQFIVIDEVASSNKPSIAQLKALTSGSADIGSINRKSYGQSYIPRRDAQFIILSNQSPYDVYAVTDPRTKLRRCRDHDMGPLECRFHIIRLDGDDAEEKALWYHPKSLSFDDYMWHLRYAFYEEVRLANSSGNCSTALVKRAMTKIYKIHMMRHEGTGVTFKTMAKELQHALHPDDYRVLLDVFNRFMTEQNIPPCPESLEYVVHFAHDPQADHYGELLTAMKYHPALEPTFDCRNELTDSGPVVSNARRKRVADQAAEELKTMKRSRAGTVAPGNQHHGARPLGTNAINYHPAAHAASLREELQNPYGIHTVTQEELAGIQIAHYHEPPLEIDWLQAEGDSENGEQEAADDHDHATDHDNDSDNDNDNNVNNYGDNYDNDFVANSFILH